MAEVIGKNEWHYCYLVAYFTKEVNPSLAKPPMVV